MTATDLAHAGTPTSLAEQMDFARTVVSRPEGGAASILPEPYRGNPANVLIAVGLGASMGLSPAESLYRIAVIKGKPTAGAELIAANVRRAGHRLRVRGDETTCTATVIRADDPDYEFTVTRDIAWAQRMGLATSDNYRKQPGTMLQWRAITAVARLACPEALYGVVYTADEVEDVRPAAESPASRPASGADRLRSALGTPVPESTPAEDVRDAEVVPDEPTPGPDPTPLVDPKGAQMRALQAAFRDAGITERDDRLAFAAEVARRPLGSASELTQAEASAVIDELKAITPGADGVLAEDGQP